MLRVIYWNKYNDGCRDWSGCLHVIIWSSLLSQYIWDAPLRTTHSNLPMPYLRRQNRLKVDFCTHNNLWIYNLKGYIVRLCISTQMADGIKPLPELIFTYHQYSPVAYIWWRYYIYIYIYIIYIKIWLYQSVKQEYKLHVKISSISCGD